MVWMGMDEMDGVDSSYFGWPEGWGWVLKVVTRGVYLALVEGLGDCELVPHPLQPQRGIG